MHQDILATELAHKIKGLRTQLHNPQTNDLWVRQQAFWLCDVIETVIIRQSPEYRSQSPQGTQSRSDGRTDKGSDRQG